MTIQDTQSTNDTISLPVAQLKALLQSASNEDIAKFMHGYSVGFAAHQFIEIMNIPDQRIGFFVAIAKTYPDDWEKAIEVLKG
jgi:hypothetical protein